MLILLTYFLYPEINKKSFITEEPSKIEKDDSSKTTKNFFENVEYNGLYNIDNPFIIKSKKASISNDEPDIINMTNMIATIEMNDGRNIVITSDNGIYNKKTYDCFFINNVKATDGETILLSDNIDLLASQDTAAIYNNVILKSNKGSLLADKIEYDFETKYYKVSMFEDKRVKVKLVK